LGRTDPAFRFGIQNILRYNNFTLRFFVNSIQGGKDAYLGVIQQGDHQERTSQNNHFIGMLDYWSPSNPDGKHAFHTSYHEVSIMAPKYQSRSFIRLQDISLAYGLSPSIIQSIGVKELKLYISGKNVLTFTDWYGWDPETGVGFVVGSLPTMKSYTLGIDISF